jgi:hypothetical protein
MTTKVKRSTAVALMTGVSALVLLVVNATAALAAPTMLVNGRLVEFGRSNAARLQSQGPANALGALAVSVAVVAVVSALLLSLDRRSQRRVAAVPDRRADEWKAISDRQESAGTQSSEQDRERKAA